MRVLLSLLLLLSPMARAATIVETTEEIRDKLGRVIQEVDRGELTWGETEALEDLKGLSASTTVLETSLPEGTPTTLEPVLTEVSVYARRVRTSSSMLTLSPEGAADLARAVALSGLLEERFSGLRNRFDGRQQPSGEQLAATDLSAESDVVVYENPEALLREARSLRRLSEEIRNRFPFWGVGLPGRGNADPQDIREMVLASYRFEDECLSPYEDVSQTRDSYKRFLRAYYRAGLDYGYSDQPATRQLRRAVERLDTFYSKQVDY